MPRGLPRAVKICLEKSRDSALTAVEIYNKPAVSFKSGGYIVLMVIAWTSLFHAIFFRNKIKPFHRDKGGRRFLKLEGDYKYWELDTCLNEYFKSDSGNPIKLNLEFFCKLRNIIEHKSLPELDSNIFGECQALLLNYDEILEKEFGAKYCIRELLTFSLQLYPSSDNLSKAVLNNPLAQKAVDFIENYRSLITTSTLESGKYSFKAFLIQVANHPSKNALPIQFVQYDKLNESEKHTIKRIATLVKFKYKEVPVLNVDLLRASAVTKIVQKGLGNPKVIRNEKERDKFTIDTHTRCWKKYEVRPGKNSENPERTITKYCLYDKIHKDYLYTKEWADFLIEKMKDDNEYNSLYL
jgi:hypothetical protein